jgi:hypothetical protein
MRFEIGTRHELFANVTVKKRSKEGRYEERKERGKKKKRKKEGVRKRKRYKEKK